MEKTYLTKDGKVKFLICTDDETGKFCWELIDENREGVSKQLYKTKYDAIKSIKWVMHSVRFVDIETHTRLEV